MQKSYRSNGAREARVLKRAKGLGRGENGVGFDALIWPAEWHHARTQTFRRGADRDIERAREGASMQGRNKHA